MRITPFHLRKLKTDTREYYKKIKSIENPYFKDEIIFNSKGFKHLIYEDKGHQRSIQEQHLRLILLPIGMKMLSITTVVQEYEERVLNDKMFKYWGFIGIIDEEKIKVIIRQIGEGKKHFYSIFPKWVTRQSIEK